VRLSGWIHRKRDHGGLMFVDLRDHYGVHPAGAGPRQRGLRGARAAACESVIRIEGEVVARSADTVNANLPTGEVEIRVRERRRAVRSSRSCRSRVRRADYPEDLRPQAPLSRSPPRDPAQEHRPASQVISSIRRRMTDAGFNELQTPILTASSPEGARDFLVPSRLHPGEFYALPRRPSSSSSC
jgi:aspartyl-tRNA synthetase